MSLLAMSLCLLLDGCVSTNTKENVEVKTVRPLTSHCYTNLDAGTVMKAAFESRAAQSVQFFENYIERLKATIEVLRAEGSTGNKVCLLYALDEYADLYATKLVKFDLANQANNEAYQLLSEVDCCQALSHTASSYFPATRHIYSYLFGPNNTSPHYPMDYLSEVARHDFEEVTHRIKKRKVLLEIMTQTRAPMAQGIAEPIPKSNVSKDELRLWEETIKPSELPEELKASLVFDRVWRLRADVDTDTWQTLVLEAGRAALRVERRMETGSRQSIELRQRLGYALLRTGEIEEGIHTYEDMLTKIAQYQNNIEAQYDRVHSAIRLERMKEGSKLAAATALTGLSYAFNALKEAAPYLGLIPIVGFAAETPVLFSNLVQNSLLGVGPGTGVAASVVDSFRPDLQDALKSYEYTRYKALETGRLFGEMPKALPLFFNEHDRLEFHRAMGLAYERLGRNQAAISHYQNAIEIIESERAGLGRESTRLAFLQDKEVVYERLITLLVRRKEVDAAFNYSERARSRNFVDLLASSAPHFRVISEAKTYEQWQREQAETEIAVRQSGLTYQEVNGLREYYRGINVVKGNPPSAAGVATEQPPTPRLALSEDFISLLAVQTAPLPDIQAILGSKAALLSFYVGEEQTVVFLLNNGERSAWLRPIGRTALNRQVAEFRQLIKESSRSKTSPRPIQQLGHQLYDSLLKDIIGKLDNAIVYLAPHGPLHYLPFVALHDGNQYLIQRYTLVNVPSGTVLTYLAKKRRNTKGATVVFANPDLEDPEMDLPFAEQEGKMVLARKPQAKLLTRKAAQEHKVHTLQDEPGILHFATHGIFDPEKPMQSSLLLAKGEGHDGILTASEIFSLNLPGSLVVLSGCETGRAQVATGDEILGLTRAFMYAGAFQVIATLWEIDDQATSMLMSQFYEKMIKEAPSSALRAGQLHLYNLHREPFYWAGFVSYGIEP